MKNSSYLAVLVAIVLASCNNPNSPESIVGNSVKVMSGVTDYLFDTSVNYQGDLIRVQGGVHKPDSVLFRMIVGELAVEIFQKDKNNAFVNNENTWVPLAQDQKEKIKFITDWVLNDYSFVKKAKNLKAVIGNSKESLTYTFDLDAGDVSLDPQASPTEGAIVPKISGLVEVGALDGYMKSLVLQYSFDNKGKTERHNTSIQMFNFENAIPLPKL